MSKVLVDRELLEQLLDEGPRSVTWAAQEQARAILAKPAEAEVASIPLTGEYHIDCGYLMNLVDDQRAALSAVTAERDRLRDAAGKAIAWLDAEQNGSGVGINRILKLCRDAENSLRAAMAAKEA